MDLLLDQVLLLCVPPGNFHQILLSVLPVYIVILSL